MSGFESRAQRRRSMPSTVSTQSNHRYPTHPIATFLALALFSASLQSLRAQTAPATSSDNMLYAEIAKAPAKATARPNPMEHDRDALLAGQKLYERHCAECHGEGGEGGKGSKKGPSLRAPEVQQATAGTLFWVLTNGVVRRGMPVWSKLPEPQRWQLVTYVKSLSGPAKSQAGQSSFDKSGGN
jgi:mono/diheme cytochrome c family protein